MPLLHASVIYKGGGLKSEKETDNKRKIERERESLVRDMRAANAGLETWNKRGSVWRAVFGRWAREARGACAYVHTFVHLRIGRRFMGISGVLWVAGGRSVCTGAREASTGTATTPGRREREGSCSGAYTRGGWSNKDGKLRDRDAQDRDRERVDAQRKEDRGNGSVREWGWFSVPLFPCFPSSHSLSCQYTSDMITKYNHRRTGERRALCQ